MVACAYVSSYVGSTKYMDHNPGWPRKKSKTLFLKLTTAKRARDMVQVVECLPSKSKAPSSNPSTGKKKKEVYGMGD
jgi:hypothetical protein